MKRLALVLLVMATACAGAPAFADLQLDTYAGTEGVLTRGEKREYVAARVALSKTFGPRFSAWLRVDGGGEQDAGSLTQALGIPKSFRDVDAFVGLRYAITPKLQLAGLVGTTRSIEGRIGAPLDPRMLTYGGLLERRLGDGYLAAGGGISGPVGGGAVLASAFFPLDGRLFGTFDVAVPVQRAGAAQVLPWVVKVGVLVRVKSLVVK